ncbi:MAG: hypothetical protein HC932_04720 [Thermales bacterium]|nr:hypothetical protein [Thermales bacterium]
MNDDLNSSDFGSTVGIFDNLDPEEIKDTFIEKNFNNTNLVNHDLYINLNFKNLSSIVEGSKLNLYTENKQNLYQNRSKILHPINRELVKSIDLEADSSYYIINGEQIIPIKTDELKNSYGEFDDNISIIKTKNKDNQIPNPSFDEPILWQDQVGNCNNNSESTPSSSSMRLKGDQNYLELGTYKSISCTNTNAMSVDSSKRYVLSFDFQSPNSKFAGYHIGFDNKNKELSEKIPVIDSQWGSFHKIVNVPKNSTKATLTVYSYSSSGGLILTGYDNFKFAEFEDLGIIKIKEPTANFQKLSLDQQTNKFTYFDPSLKYDNLITNNSFEEGLLGQKVGNCNEYDNNPSISMSLSNDAKSGKQSLQLETKRHTACFSPGVFRVKEGQVYNFSFWYKSEKAKQVGYYIGFNDINKISTNKRVDVFNDDWNKVTETFRVPKGATTASIFINNFEGSNSEVIKTNFDDLKLIKLPDLSGKYYLVNHSLVEKNNTQVEYNIVNPTTINLSINNITDPNYLKFSQSYHSQWKLRPKSSTKFSDENHHSLYGYLNGWYIDPTDVCLKYIDSCSLRPDGSYDIEMVIEFWPQRIFNLGLVVSSATLLSIVIYIGYSYWRKKKTKVKSNKIILKSSSQQIEVFINKVKKFILIGKPVDKTNVIQKTQQKRLKTKFPKRLKYSVLDRNYHLIKIILNQINTFSTQNSKEVKYSCCQTKTNNGGNKASQNKKTIFFK